MGRLPVGLAIVTLLLATASGCAFGGPSRPAAIPTDGPLVGLSVTSGFQSGVHTTLPLFLGDNVEISDLDRRPVTVTAVAAWDGDHLRLTDAGFIMLPPGKNVNGFGGQGVRSTVAAQGVVVASPAWAGTRSLVGARIQPCCRLIYHVGLAFTPDLHGSLGRTRGIVLTYRTAAGRVYRTFVAAEMGFCTGPMDSRPCQVEGDAESDQFDRAVAHAITYQHLRAAGSWHG